MVEKVYICPEDCNYFRGGLGCVSSHIDIAFTYKKEGDYPLCPFYMRDLLSPKGEGLHGLSDEELDAYCKKIGLTNEDWDEGGGFVHEAVVRVIQQAKEEGMRKVMEELRLRGDMSMNFPFSNIRKDGWQVFEKKALEGGQKPFDDCPNDCENFPHCANTEGCLERLQERSGGKKNSG